MGRSLHKKDRLTIRFTDEQLGKIRRAAKLEGARRGELVEPGSLLRELAMPRIDEILASSLTASQPAA